MLNEYYQNIGIKGFLKRYGLLNALRRGVYTANPFHRVKDYEVKKLLWQKKASKRIRKYLKYSNQNPIGLEFPKESVDDPIWVYWNTGIDNAPDIVKCCFESLKRYGGKQIIVLSDDNLEEYIKMPEYIEKKRNLGSIPLAIYTDLVRFALLEHYGGIWVDSTVYLTEVIPKEIINTEFFAFQNSLGLIDNPVLYPVWFLRAKKNSVLMKRIRNVVFAYWKKENHLIEYLQSNLIITAVVDGFQNSDIDIPYINSDYSEYLIKVLADEYSEIKWNWINNLTGIHKLTYKLDKDIDNDKSFYRYIMIKNNIRKN